MKSPTQKNAAGLTAADIARLSPAARAKAESILRATDEARQRQREKRFEVSFFSKRHKKKLTVPFPIVAATKSAAIAEAKARQSGNQKDFVNFVAREVRMNPKKSKAKNPKRTATYAEAMSAGRDAANRRMKKAGRKSWNADDYKFAVKTFNGLYSGKRQNPPTEQNFLGFGKDAKKKRRRKARAKAAYYAELARNPNPKGIAVEIRENGKLKSSAVFATVAGARTFVQRALSKAKQQNPMHPLEVGSHLAAILGGTHHLSQMMKSKKKKARRPSASAAGKRLAQRKHGSVRGKTKTIKRAVRNAKSVPPAVAGGSKARRNSHGEIYEMFTGSPSERITTGYVAADAPKNVDQLAPVVQLTLANGKHPVTIGSKRDGTARRIMGEVRRFNKNAVMLGATKRSGKARFVGCAREIDVDALLERHPRANGNFDYGPIAEVVYGPVAKPHLGVNKPVYWYHLLGEEGGRRPKLLQKNGMPVFAYGDYEITAEGIRN